MRSKRRRFLWMLVTVFLASVGFAIPHAAAAEPDACVAQKPVNVTGAGDGCVIQASGYSANYVSTFTGAWRISGPGVELTGSGPAVGSLPLGMGEIYRVILGDGAGAFTIASKPGIAGTPEDETSPFSFRGVVQSFYGRPWSHAERMDHLRWMAAHDLNMYLHAPKEDPFQRANWREPYPLAEMNDLREEFALASRLGVTWVPNLSPGLPLIPGRPSPSAPPSRDVCFSCPGDLTVIFAKLDPFFDAGARTLMVSFDDIQKTSSHPEDSAAIGNDDMYGAMNRSLLNAVYRHYRDRAAPGAFRLLTVLADYSGAADTPYLRGIRSDGGLDRGIEVLWTGTEVFSASITSAPAATYAGLVGREKVLIWDNYPVNDQTNAADSPRLYLGPYNGRAKDLSSSVAGIFANPMREAIASRIPLATFADYLRSPQRYEPEISWRRAMVDMGGRDAALTDAVAVLAENSRSSVLDRAESREFVAGSTDLLAAVDEGPFWTQKHAALIRELARESSSPDVIRAASTGLSAEVAGWLDRLVANVDAARAAASVLAALRPSLEVGAIPVGRAVRVGGRALPPSPGAVLAGRAQLEAAFAMTLGHYQSVHGDRFTMFSPYTGMPDENRVDAFVRAIRERADAWMAVAAVAAGSVRVSVNGVPAQLDPAGRFSLLIPRGVHLVEVVATDGANGTTGLRIGPNN